MELSIEYVKEEDRGVLAPCGIICLGCEIYQNESLDAAKKVVDIWEGFNLVDVAQVFGMESEEVANALDTLKKFIRNREEAGPCQGCYSGKGPTPALCSLSNCAKSKGYWTCAECTDFGPYSTTPCPHADQSDMPLGSRDQTSAVVCERYSSDNLKNLERCREIGYTAFVSEIREKVDAGWRTWQVISEKRLFAQE
jgi:hypothetical protein